MQDQNLKRFSGDGQDRNQYTKWKKWAKSTMAWKKIGEEERGSFVYTLLDGTALEAVDHLEFT